MQVAVTEFPVICIPVALILFVTCFWLEKYKAPAMVITSIALLLFSVPIVRAYMKADGMKDQLISVLPGCEEGSNQLSSPYSFLSMFSGQDIEEVTPQTHPYTGENTKTWDFDFYASASKEKSPCVIVIHSGSWSSGDNKEFPELNSYLANRGYNVAAINYRLAPEYKSPSQVEDVATVISQLKANADAFNVDTNNFVLLGRSAGGQIALCAAYTLRDPSIKGVISYYAPCDMVWGAKITGNKLVLDTDKVFEDYLGGGYDQFADKYYESSAVQHVTPHSPPTLIIHGDNDCMVSYTHSVHLDSALTANNVGHYFLNLPGATHACDYNISGPSGQLCTFTVERFVASVTRL